MDKLQRLTSQKENFDQFLDTILDLVRKFERTATYIDKTKVLYQRRTQAG